MPKHIIVTDEDNRMIIARESGNKFSPVAEVLYRQASSAHGRELEAWVIARALDTITPADYDAARRGFTKRIEMLRKPE